ncbi:helix-turn-helix domain-containing protein [Pedobacter rhizosphaerae]|uniref:Transcriptional regulator, AraC family n=1 Tax=Pedobacter rhizosphaerae TaxID=390241 RepID=A0A1H9SJU9_9SPHI|nr:AraC family transcriptional regulator [Pedobacter rhizosphaerae]SER85242.1 transcriptional regulator, AraC family [Pedobacter rhizosphaerae]
MQSSQNQHPLSAPRLIQNEYYGKNVEGEAMVADHIFSYIISGSHEVWIGEKKYLFKAGDYRFFKRNQLTKFVKLTESEGFRSIAIHIDQATLKEISAGYELKPRGHYRAEGVKLINSNGFLESFVATLKPYLGSANLDNGLLRLKTKELILILAESDPDIKHMLFEFSDPGKLDLEAFMNGHYRYNVPLERFAFLTGRSLSGFKRDFAKLFQVTPGRWLLQKRLAEARYLIEQQFQRPTKVYLELGFVNMSHFSYAYKKAFGKAPSNK